MELQRNPSSAESCLTPRQEIISLLSQHVGLNRQSIGDSAINRAITQAIKLSGLKDDRAYLQQLKTSKVVLETLIDEVVVPETSFFRNPESFDYLAQYILKFQKDKSIKQPLRVLSLPCASGEEPYSIAITLLEAGLSHGQFQVDGVDISQKALSKARQGIYAPYSFRNTASFSPQYYLDKYFTLVDQNRYQINALARVNIEFYPGNLSDSIYAPNHKAYDIIFCRNLLIYFHPSARERALYNLYRLLTPNGLLFVGYAEASQISQHKFESLCVPQAFVYRKVSQWPQDKKPSFIASQGLSPSKNKSLQSVNKPFYQPTSNNQPPPKPPSEDLAKIRKLADAGELVTALEQCDVYLQAHPMSAEAYLLLGEIYQAQGSDERADMAFHRVLYLQPDCVEALTHRLLICEQKSDQTTAQKLRQRIYRLTKK